MLTWASDDLFQLFSLLERGVGPLTNRVISLELEDQPIKGYAVGETSWVGISGEEVQAVYFEGDKDLFLSSRSEPSMEEPSLIPIIPTRQRPRS
jgi:hypothetical protein